MSLLTRTELLGRKARRYTTVDVPGGGKVRIRSLTEAERSRYELSAIDPKTNEWSRKAAAGSRRRLVALCVVDGDGNQLLTEADVVDLAEVDAAVVDRIFDAARDWNGFTKRDIDELEKNSERPRERDSSDGSRSAGESSTSSDGSPS